MSWAKYVFAAQIPGWDSPITWINWTRPVLIYVAGGLGGVFIVWMLTANGIYYATFGDARPTSIGGFVSDIFTTKAGWTMTIVGIAVGALFAALVLATSVISFPLLLDRDVGLPVAVIPSMRVAAANPVPIAVWGLIVAVGLSSGIPSWQILAGLGVLLVAHGLATRPWLAAVGGLITAAALGLAAWIGAETADLLQHALPLLPLAGGYYLLIARPAGSR